MKKLFSLLTLALLTLSAWATTYTHTFASGDLTTSAGDVTLSGLTWTQTEATAINFDNSYGRGIQIGTGTNPTMSFSLSTSAITGTITKVTVNASTASKATATMNVTVGETSFITDQALTSTATDYVGSGNATGTVVITLTQTTSKALYIKSITIEYEGGEEPPIVVATPVITPNGGVFKESQTVTITCDTEGATIMYALNDGEFQQYNNAITLTETTTIKAKGVYGEIESEEVSATFRKVEDAPANTFMPYEYTAVENQEFTVEKDGVTLYCSNGTITSDQFRFYKNQTVTFTKGEDIADIVKIEFTCTANGTAKEGPGCLALNEGQNGLYTYETDGNMGTWTGKAASISFNTNANQVRATKIVFTLDDGTTITVAAPTFDPATCEFEESIDVTINAEEGATIKYALNDGEFTDYTAPIHLTATTTIKAKAVKNEVESEVATATYTLKATGEGTMYDFVALTDTLPGYDNPDATTAGAYTITKDRVTFKVSNGSIANYTDNSGNEYHEYRIYKNATIKFSTTKGKIVKIEFLCTSVNPATGFGTNVEGMTFDGNNGTWTGNAVNVTFTASAKQVRAEEIIVYVEGDEPNIIVANPVFTPEKNTVFDENIGLEVSISCETEGATIYYSTDGENYEQYENPFTINETTTVSAFAQVLDVVSDTVYAKYNAATMVYDIDEANALDDGVSFYFQGNAVVTYKNGQNLWIRDASGSGLIYGNSIQNGTFNQGDVLKTGWDAQKKNYGSNGFDKYIPEFQYPNNVEASGETQTVEPTEYTTITTDNVNEYIIMKGQTLTNMTNADGLVFFDKFHIENLNIEDGKTYDITGIVTIYHDAPEVYIITATEAASEVLLGDVDDDGKITISDVTVLIDYLLGSNPQPFNAVNADVDTNGNISISDVTALIDILLSM